MEFLYDYYLHLRVFHFISLIAWMAGLLYLPRIFVYHKTVKIGSEADDLFKIMERRLYKAIMVPAMIFTLTSGLLLVIVVYKNIPPFLWFHLKLTCVICLVIYQLSLNHWRHQLAMGTCERSSMFFRAINEIPTVLMIFIIIFVVIKPF